MKLSVEEIKILFEALAKVYGPGLSTVPGIGMLQAKLSIMLEVAMEMEARR